MKSITILGKEPCITLIKNALKDDICSEVIVFDEDFRLNAVKLTEKSIVFLGFMNEQLSNSVREWLLDEYNLCAGQIIDYIGLCQYMMPKMRVDAVFSAEELVNYDGLIMGLSHAKVGILPELMDGRYVNISVSSQDIYHNYKTLEHIYTTYYDYIKKLKYVVYDMFDYTYFNYDCSLSSTAIDYYFRYGGILDKHNFDNNKNYEDDFGTFCNRYEVQKRTLDFDARFVDKYVEKCKFVKGALRLNDSIINSRWRIVSQKEIDDYDIDNSLVNKRFDNTINENIKWFRKTMELLKRINPEMKVLLVIMPHLPEALIEFDEKYIQWREYFYDTLTMLKEDYDFEFYDYKLTPLFSKRLYFYDCEHLNYFGARKFTNLLMKHTDV